MDVLGTSGADRSHRKRFRAPIDASGLYSNGHAPKASKDGDGKRRSHKTDGHDSREISWTDKLTEELFGFVPDDLTQKSPGRKRRETLSEEEDAPPPPPPGPVGLDQAEEDDSSDSAEFAYDRPIHFVDHSEAFSRLKLFAETTYKNYSKQLHELLKTKSATYANPIHSRRGFDGDLRMHQLRQDLLGFEDKPIELQMKMYVFFIHCNNRLSGAQA
jgi:hypothetical protein